MNANIDLLRNKHRATRAKLAPSLQKTNAHSLFELVSQQAEYIGATNIASYIAIRGEMDTSLLMQGGGSHRNIFLPVLREEQMLFALWKPGEELKKKGFGLLEPESTDWIEPTELDLVLTPLVVFDSNCNRIGQGGGYYDRTFAHRLADASADCCKPVLMGVAHDCQRELHLQPQPWDVPLDLIVTERSIYRRETL